LLTGQKHKGKAPACPNTSKWTKPTYIESTSQPIDILSDEDSLSTGATDLVTSEPEVIVVNDDAVPEDPEVDDDEVLSKFLILTQFVFTEGLPRIDEEKLDISNICILQSYP
jgi:hypothetical protein